jgi:enediyne biosynthesis protein E4
MVLKSTLFRRVARFVLAGLCCILRCASAQTKFVDKTAELGLSLANDQVCCVDIDNDGWIDLYSIPEHKLYKNIGGKRFVEFPLPALPAAASRGACWVDLNGDGFPDLYIGGYEDWDKDITYPSMILLNQGGKSFKLIWQDANFRTRGVTACDYNMSGHPSVYVSNYRLQANRLISLKADGTPVDSARYSNAIATSDGFDGGHSIGACWADFNNDGLFDLFAGNFAHVDSRGDQPKSRFLMNTGAAGGFRFEDLGTCGVFYQESYASPAAADFDNDGMVDLVFTTVYGVASFGRPNHAVLFKNRGGFQFTDVTAEAGLADQPPTYQAAWADFNHDGSVDLILGGHLYMNTGSHGHWLEVSLKGDGKIVNTSAIGAQVRVYQNGRILSRQVEAGTGEGNQNDLTLHCGLGFSNQPVTLEVRWPNGETKRVMHVKPDQRLTINYTGKRR